MRRVKKKQNSKIEVLFTFLVKTELFFKVCGINQIGQYRIINGTCFGSDTFTIITKEYQKLDQVHLACRTQLLLPGLVAVVHHVHVHHVTWECHI